MSRRYLCWQSVEKERLLLLSTALSTSWLLIKTYFRCLLLLYSHRITWLRSFCHSRIAASVISVGYIIITIGCGYVSIYFVHVFASSCVLFMFFFRFDLSARARRVYSIFTKCKGIEVTYIWRNVISTHTHRTSNSIPELYPVQCERQHFTISYHYV